MAFKLEDVIGEQIKELSPESITAIEKSVNKSIDTKLEAIEADNARKFDEFVDNITAKFDARVNDVVLESAKDNTGNLVNQKLYGIVKDIANLVESAGITTTEKTKELRQKLKQADEKLENSYKDREEIKGQLDDEMKKTLIYAKLKGMKPEIVDLALETFKGKDIREIDDEAIEAFLDGDFTDLVADSVEDDNFGGDIELDQVRDALAEIDDSKKTGSVANNKVFESLGKGLKHQRALSTPDVTYEDLNRSAHALTEGADGDIEPDAINAMSKINEMKDFGLSFQ